MPHHMHPSLLTSAFSEFRSWNTLRLQEKAVAVSNSIKGGGGARSAKGSARPLRLVAKGKSRVQRELCMWVPADWDGGHVMA